MHRAVIRMEANESGVIKFGSAYNKMQCVFPICADSMRLL